MSLATLKKKSQAKYNAMSVNAGGFSLNGTRRIQGYVGQTTQGRYLPGGKMKGPDNKGSGTCCGKYINNPAESPLIGCLTEDPNTVKKSSLNSSGMLMSHYRWIRRGDPYTTVKETPNAPRTHSAHLDTISREHALLIEEANRNALCNQTLPPENCRKLCGNVKEKQGKIEHYTRSGSQYIAYKLNKCQEFVNPRPAPRPSLGFPIACRTAVSLTPPA